MSKIFISLPMHGKTDMRIEQDIATATLFITTHLDPEAEIITGHMPCDLSGSYSKNQLRVRCLGRSIGIMATCDAVFFCPGWEHANGCEVEHMIAYKYSLPAYHLCDFAGGIDQWELAAETAAKK